MKKKYNIKQIINSVKIHKNNSMSFSHIFTTANNLSLIFFIKMIYYPIQIIN